MVDTEPCHCFGTDFTGLACQLMLKTGFGIVADVLGGKTPTNARAPLVSINSTQPLELVCMDFLALETSKGGYQHMLIITDQFTRYAQAIPTWNMTAKTTAEAFYNHFVMHYGILLRIHSDQGANFESRLLRELCHIVSIEKSRRHHTTHGKWNV